MKNTMKTPLARSIVAVCLTLSVTACGTFGEKADVALGPRADALAHFKDGRFGLAITGFRAALAENPDSVIVRNRLAASYAMAGRADLAERHFHRALNVAPRDAQTLNNLGNFYLSYGKPDAALVYLMEAKSFGGQEGQRIARNIARAERALKEESLAPVSDVKSVELDEAADERQARIERITAHIQRLQTRRQYASSAPIAASSSAPSSNDSLGGNRREAAVEPLSDVAVEVSNGAGMRHMARLVSSYLDRRQVPIGRLTNADHFRHQVSTLYYRPGRKAAAESLQSLLPGSVRLEEAAGQLADVRLELGGDLLAFARRLHQRNG